jgi:cellulose synthase/poly-beta-1,6-N-acetylglucosamine synthase-like glycosyltransferase
MMSMRNFSNTVAWLLNHGFIVVAMSASIVLGAWLIKFLSIFVEWMTRSTVVTRLVCWTFFMLLCMLSDQMTLNRHLTQKVDKLTSIIEQLEKEMKELNEDNADLGIELQLTKLNDRSRGLFW